MNAFEIRGGKSLKGEITAQGAKNEALQVLCAALLTDEPVTFSNVPDILDVNTLIEVLGDMGVTVTRNSAHRVTLQA
ncbi:MAG: UDP-N-acetylglucosamine 1-carboxyvinyltransferase, partial [Taibaiella sp.]|nr:UDP-N-acetylglucosamine 1-carboxyvinyltransferase [Taibaiella sp.]